MDENIGGLPPGKEVMNAIHSGLAKRGFVVTEVEQHSSYGWCFYIIVDDVWVWTMLQLSDTWLLISDAPVGWIQRLLGRRNSAALASACSGLHAALASSHSAKALRWFTRDEFAKNPAGGASEP